MLVDTAGLNLVQQPGRFDVMLTENTFGDILSDVAAGSCGGLGVAASASLGEQAPGIFEPVHGSAPDIAGRGIANPLAAIGADALLLDYLGESARAARVRAAVDSILRNGPHTPDLGGAATTADVTDAVIHLLHTNQLTGALAR
jgi:homoisocitrate dehydrogenase